VVFSVGGGGGRRSPDPLIDVIRFGSASLIVGILLALLIGVGSFLLLVSQK
jgi:hypothetical protein